MILSILFISVYPAHFSSISLTPAMIIPYADVQYTFLLPCQKTPKCCIYNIPGPMCYPNNIFYL